MTLNANFVSSLSYVGRTVHLHYFDFPTRFRGEREIVGERGKKCMSRVEKENKPGACAFSAFKVNTSARYFSKCTSDAREREGK